MAICSHESCGREKREWLPAGDHSGTDVILHPWCVHCGVVKNISDDKPRKLGFWLNIHSDISKKFSLKQVQKRCIAKELASHEVFNDMYSASGPLQKAVFKKIVEKHSKINSKSIESFIY